MKEKLIQAFGGLLDSTIALAPKVVLGLVLMVVGLVAAKMLEIGLRFAMRRVHFDKLIGKIGLDQMLQKLGILQELSIFIPRFVYFLVLFILAQTSADALGLVAISSAISAFFGYLPNMVAAVLLIIVGGALGQFFGRYGHPSAESSGIDSAPALGRVVSGGVFFICAMMAISQLKIDTGIVRIVTSLVLGGAALAFGLAFGLGTREIVSNIAAGYYARKVFEVGMPLEVLGHRGTLKSITATHVILESEGHEVSLANSTFLSHVAKQTV